ncbi:MAG: leucine--tRNA ligase [Anaerolineae bacterium]|nr:leucine--tRNA ligase [Anaerolineae bacterium]
MTENYNHTEIEKKWQDKWDADELYRSVIDESRPKHYALTMLPYPSGDLHIGHWYAMTPSDARARYKRMNGFNVLFPMGFDSFGLPAEGAAIKNNVHPKKWTYANIERMRTQMRTMGAMFDWKREAVSSDESYYRWSEWFFIQLYKNGLAYRKMSPVDWCPSCNTTLAREQVWGDDRHCERCGTPVIKKDLDQWFFRTTNYADEMLKFEDIDWPQHVRTLQTNWIGRSEGASVIFKVAPPLDSPPARGGGEGGDHIEVFTTRPDTLWGATFMVLSPEHPLVEVVSTEDKKAEIEAYKAEAARQSDIEREATDKEKTGVFTGGYAINPVNDERIPIWIADYVLMSYGTGAIMAVPAHDERDFEFARKFGLEVRVVIQPDDMEALDGETMEASVPAKGQMVNSGPLTGTPGDQSIAKAIEYIGKKGTGKKAINYKLRDWLISRQRYWGSPIPMIHCEKCGWNPVPEDELPVTLPEDVEWLPTGESPLKLHPTWKHVKCPECDGEAVRETDTMDTFMCSSWYHLRYLSPEYHEGPFDQTEYDYWMPVDIYTGGIEHATMHLMYTRFFHKALRDMGITKGDEPMSQLRNQGMVLGEDHDKMSKSKGNVIAPDALVDKYGADVVRAYLMFFSRWDMGGPWNSQGIEGTVRWMRRVWTIFNETVPERRPEGGAKSKGGTDMPPTCSAETKKSLRLKLHETLKSVTFDFENVGFNTIISSLMELMNEIYKARSEGAEGTPEWDETLDIYLRMLAPVAPHIAEELWQVMGNEYSIHTQEWPKVDESAIVVNEITMGVQVNGKVRDRITVAADADDDTVKAAALASENVQKFLKGKDPRKVIVIPGRLVNIVK